MRYSDLIKEYRRLRAIEANQFTLNGVSEQTVPVYENNRIRILLVRKPEEPNHIRMEVEVTLPEEMWGLNATLSFNELPSSHQFALRISLEEMITLFQYLLSLQKIGFQLDFFSTEGVWVASYDFKKEPSKTLFTRCKPPKMKVN